VPRVTGTFCIRSFKKNSCDHGPGQIAVMFHARIRRARHNVSARDVWVLVCVEKIPADGAIFSIGGFFAVSGGPWSRQMPRQAS